MLALALVALGGGCQSPGNSDPALAEFAAFRRQVHADYVAFERAQEPSAANGYSHRQYYANLLDPARNPRALSVPWLEEFEARHRGTQAGLEALTMALGHLRFQGNGDGRVVETADAYYGLLVDHYLDFEGLGDVCYLGNLYLEAEDFLGTMEAFVDGSPHRTVRAKAIAAQLHLFQSARLFDEQLECVDRLLRDYADVVYQNTPCGELARKSLVHHYEAEQLEVGRPAPEIAGYDVNGQPVALSDYRGQVVVVAFVGFWCIYCRELIPDERALADELREAPFTFLLLVSDDDMDYARARLEGYGIDSPHIFMPWGTRSPSARVWRVEEWPTVFVLDPSGIIRYRSESGNLRGKSLETAVLHLLDS